MSSSESDELDRKKKRCFDVGTKLMAIECAEKMKDKSAAARKFGVSRSTLQGWFKQKDKIKEAEEMKGGMNAKRIKGGGRKLKDSEFDKELANWIREMRAKKLRVTRKMIQCQAIVMWKDDEDFSASEGWLNRFMARHGLSTRRPTTVCQKEPAEYVKGLIDYILYLENLRKKNNYVSIYACDETGIFLDNSNSLTIADKGAKDVTVLSTGHDKMRITVMLTAREDGFKCKPFVLLNRVRPDPKIIAKFQNKLQLHWGGSTWMNDASIEAYLRKILGVQLFGQRLIVWDNFSAHKSKATRKMLKDLQIDSIMVPGGCTKYIQAPDVVWNAPFKARIRAQYEEWMVNGPKLLTRNGNAAPPPMDTYLEWVWNSWSELPKNLIIHSFKNCAITTATDGSEDNLIHCFKKEGPIPEGAKLLADARLKQSINGVNDQLRNIELDEEDNNSSDNSIVDVLTS